MSDFFSINKKKPKVAESSVLKSNQNLPWVEKYRPKTIDDVAYQEEVVNVLRSTITGNNFPNLLFYGRPGTGKTSTILAVCKQLFGHDLYKSRVLELNASDERGIQVIREKVKNFASQSVSSFKVDGTPCPPFKVVILDEADSMTTSAQAALRRTMERQTKTTRFCLICNYVSRIIEPITSRCAKFRFKELSSNAIYEQLKYISRMEAVKIEEEALEQLIESSDGDMRKAITYLQSAHRLKLGEIILANDIFEMTGKVPKTMVADIMKACSSGSFEKLDKQVKLMMTGGYSASQLITQLHDEIISLLTINDKQKSIILEKLAIVEKCLCDGADEYLQIMAIGTVIMESVR
ncbi:replication factor C subunit 4 isoform X1 [Hydra vulgaris]|uniref:replication factor C subunit 4 isoform X1 n=1 Tax=Hydra vulgaris TaxID=6087 RepID=UPI000641599A|nr:replication factor C subunit 4 [Hydra vulgaris]